MNKRYSAKDVAFDGLFSALSVMVMMSTYFLPVNRNLLGTMLLVFFACAYAKRKLVSGLITSGVIICLSFLLMDPLVVLFYVFPSLLFGLVLRKFVRKDKTIFYPCSIVLLTLLFFFESFLYTSFFLQENFIDYVMREGIDLSIFGVDQGTEAGRMGTWIGFVVLGVILAILETILFDNFREYYDQRIRFLVERKK